MSSSWVKRSGDVLRTGAGDFPPTRGSSIHYALPLALYLFRPPLLRLRTNQHADLNRACASRSPAFCANRWCCRRRHRFVDPTDPAVSEAFHRRVGILTGKKGHWVGLVPGRRDTRRPNVHGSDDDDPEDVEDPMSELMKIEKGGGSLSRPACYTCGIEMPLRSRYCRNSRRCVRAFDHYCPFVGNCVGASNYRWFFLYVVFLVLRWVDDAGSCLPADLPARLEGLRTVRKRLRAMRRSTRAKPETRNAIHADRTPAWLLVDPHACARKMEALYSYRKGGVSNPPWRPKVFVRSAAFPD